MDRIKRLSMEVLDFHKDKFGTDFGKNKKVLDEIAIIRSKELKNELAGFITKHIKRQIREEKEKEEKEQASQNIEKETQDQTKGQEMIQAASETK